MSVKKTQIFQGLVALSLSAGVYAAPAVLGTQVSVGVVGDANGDGIANYLDLNIATVNQNTSGNLSKGDFNGDGLVNASDLTLINKNYLRHQPDAFFGKIVDKTVTMPGSSPSVTFGQFDPAVIDTLGNISFVGSNGISGVYKWSAGTLSRVADSNTVIPGTASTKYTGFTQPSISQNKVYFQGTSDSTQGIYSYVGTTLSRIADKTTARPEGGTFSDMSDPEYVDPYAAFIGSSGSASSVYTAVGTTLTTVASTADLIPGGLSGTKFTSFGNALSNGTSTWFIGRGASSQIGIYKKTGGTLINLVDKNTTVPGTALKFGSGGTGGFGSLSQDGDNISFSGIFGGKSGVFAIFGSNITRIADQTTSMPEGRGKFSSFGVTSSIGGNAVAFVGYDASSNPGIYAWINGELERVIDNGVTLGGKIIAALELSRNAVVGNKVVFGADFTDGSSGIYAASLLRSRLPGDVNSDGAVNMADMAIMMANQGQSGGRSRGDLNWDGLVDVRDYQILSLNLGKAGAAPLLGDTDGDGKVDLNDYKTLLSNTGKYGGFGQGDFNGDGAIDMRDYQLLMQNFGKTQTAFQPFGATALPSDVPEYVGAVSDASAPEPTGALVAISGLIMLMGGRRRRARQV